MNEWKFVVLTGGFTGDGSAEHRLFRNDSGDRVPVFNSHAAAEAHVLMHRLGAYSLIAEVMVTAHPATELRSKSGSRITVTET